MVVVVVVVVVVKVAVEVFVAVGIIVAIIVVPDGHAIRHRDGLAEPVSGVRQRRGGGRARLLLRSRDVR